MNPGYAGRSNLPDNLKKLFRSMAMTRPDRELIAQVMLFSQGFRTAETLASKIVPFFNLCSEQLSSQPHYDFGLRALKSVLVSAGHLKRERLAASAARAEGGAALLESVDISEQEILIQSVTETIVPKLVADDVPLLTRSVLFTLASRKFVHSSTFLQPSRRRLPRNRICPRQPRQAQGAHPRRVRRAAPRRR